MKKMHEFVEEVEKEIVEEKKELAKEVLKDRIREVKDAERTLLKLRKQYESILDKDIDDVIDDVY